MSEAIEQLARLFGKFPGIGPRQAKRFIYFLLSERPEYVQELVRTISELSRSVKQCPQCYRYHQDKSKDIAATICKICSDTARQDDTLLLVERDVDFETIHKSGTYKGKYFILGGSIPILEKNPAEQIRLNELRKRVMKDLEEGRLKEIIIALSATPQGDYTTEFLKGDLLPVTGSQIKVSVLGRGLSTGTELEYSDSETIRHALHNRA